MTIDPRTDAAKAKSLIPGEYERNTLIHREPAPTGAFAVAMPTNSTMDAATIADREREGGGGPSQRRRKMPVDDQAGAADSDATRNRSWLTEGYRWFQRLGVARR